MALFRGSLVLSHNWGGGSEKYLRETLIKGGDFLVVRAEKRRITIDLVVEQLVVERWCLPGNSLTTSLVFGVLRSARFDNLHINSLAGFRHGNTLVSAIEALGKACDGRVFFYVHDHHALCPGVFLLNERGTFCGLPEGTDCEQCAVAQKFRFSMGRDMQGWRQAWLQILSACDSVICFSEASKALLVQVYGESVERHIQVRPHCISGDFSGMLGMSSGRPQTLRIGILGNLSRHKGLAFVSSLIAHAKTRGLDVEFVVIGEVLGKRTIDAKVYGKYQSKDAPMIARLLDIDLFLLASVCPETFSYVADEVMAMGYPLVVLDIGAPPERVRSYQYGKVVPYEAVAKPDVFYDAVLPWYSGDIRERARSLNAEVQSMDMRRLMNRVFFSGAAFE